MGGARVWGALLAGSSGVRRGEFLGAGREKFGGGGGYAPRLPSPESLPEPLPESEPELLAANWAVRVSEVVRVRVRVALVLPSLHWVKWWPGTGVAVRVAVAPEV